jgi:signal transduction histidine kinase
MASARFRHLLLGTACFLALIMLAELILPRWRFTFVSSELRVALEMAQALIAMLATYLLYGRFRRTKLLGDLLLAFGLGLYGAANLHFVVVTVVGASEGLLVYQTWAPLLIRLLGAFAIGYSAWGPVRRYAKSGAGFRLLCAQILSLAVVLAGVGVLSSSLPAGVEASLSSTGGAPVIEGHPVLLAAQVVLMALHWIAAAGFSRAASRGDGFAAALAVAFLLGGFSRLNFFLQPTVYTTVVQSGDFLRLGCYLALLLGAEREISSYWTGVADAAVAEERRRTARELHDGLVQELSFIRSQTSGLAGRTPDPDTVEQVARAADRALTESRLAVHVLSGDQYDEPVAVIRQAAEEVAVRAGAHVKVEAPGGIHLSSPTIEALRRIVREASSNAVRHGKAGTIVVRVERQTGSRVCLTVTDDGVGFDPDLPTDSNAFGLRSMRERAQARGGSFTVRSSPGNGACIEVVMPD